MTDTPRQFDGIVCFGGEDWWYHNRGHYDIQLMRRLSARMPVLFVNSIGMRMPSPAEGAMFAKRLRRKLSSIRRGLVAVDEGFTVMSPPVLPGRLGLPLTRPVLVRGVRRAARRCRIRRPLVWVTCPTAAEVVEALDPAAVVYQRTDRYECFSGVNPARIEGYDAWLKARADLTAFCSESLRDEEACDCRRACLIDHGVDLDRFIAADDRPAPADVSSLPRPRVGFVGGIDAHTFDPDLFLDVAGRLPEMHFVLVGACSLPAGWCDRSNVSLLGRRPYDTVPDYMAACDVLIMPWRRSPWIEACNPVKLKEYLAAGRAVVSTPFPELRRFGAGVATASDAAGFADAVSRAARQPADRLALRKLVEDQSWSTRAMQVLDELERHDVISAHREQKRVHEPPAPQAISPTVGEVSRTRLDLAACLVLAGGLRPPPLVAAAGRSVLDLWLARDQTVLDCWTGRFAEIATLAATPPAIRVVHDGVCPPPWPDGRSASGVMIEQDPEPVRGPAGVVGDICRHYGPDRHVLVAEAARYAGVSLAPLVLDHARRGTDVTVAANPDGTPSGLYVIRCAALRLVPSVGFMDLKEQWLKRAVDAGLHVRVHELAAPGTTSLRTRPQFLSAAALANGVTSDLRVVCTGSLVGPGATVTDSIVMPGAVVGADAVVARSIVVPDCHITAGTDIVDAVARPGAQLHPDRPSGLRMPLNEVDNRIVRRKLR